MNHLTAVVLLCLSGVLLHAQPQERWQQRVEYDMDIELDVETHRMKGTQKLVYYNNSNETLDKVFYHLYFNAFQPNSMMAVRSREISDPDPRMAGRFADLKEDEIGYHKIKSLKQDGRDVQFEVVGTVLEVALVEPIPPKSKVTFDMVFESQVPIQIRRSGRDNAEGIEFSMSQWFPKMAEYDYQGWHAHPYVGREFHGVWGDFDVKITLDKDYVVAGTGYVQNPNEVGHGYQDEGLEVDHSDKETLTWHFKAPNVHDFMWAADPDYAHDIVEVDDTLKLHFFYQTDNPSIVDRWKKAQDKSRVAFKYIQKRFGAYGYRKYSIIQGGDGGMEYPMGTLITGDRNLGSLMGVIVHEAMHSWYQMLMATNESLYAWMDEGFTSYATAEVMANVVFPKPQDPDYERLAQVGSYRSYRYIAKSGIEEPLSTHADHFMSNAAYGTASYSKGAVFVHQLDYIVGEVPLQNILLEYHEQWHHRHPNPNDFIRVAEKVSGLELDWYKEYFVYTTKTIDYGIDSVYKSPDSRKETRVNLRRIGEMPMPVEVVVTYKEKGEEKQQLFYMPLQIMRGEKADEGYMPRTVLPDWPWTNPTYSFDIPIKLKDIVSIVIDPSQRMADLEPANDTWGEAEKE